MNEICTEIGIEKVDLGHKNKSQRKTDYSSYYSDELIEEVYEYFKEDFELFDY